MPNLSFLSAFSQKKIDFLGENWQFSKNISPILSPINSYNFVKPPLTSHISSHNIKVLEEFRSVGKPAPRTCNCQHPDGCPLDGNCLASAIVYQADIKVEESDEHKYIGLCEPAFKGRYGDHSTSFNNPKYKTKSKLSTFVWEMKDQGKNCDISWSILRKSSPYRTGSSKCNLCLWEKFLIMKNDGNDKMVNKRDEFVSKCRHVNKFLLRNFKRRRWHFRNFRIIIIMMCYLTNHPFFILDIVIWWF